MSERLVHVEVDPKAVYRDTSAGGITVRHGADKPPLIVTRSKAEALNFAANLARTHNTRVKVAPGKAPDVELNTHSGGVETLEPNDASGYYNSKPAQESGDADEAEDVSADAAPGEDGTGTPARRKKAST